MADAAQQMFEPLDSASGGALIGLAAANVLLVHGRVAGVSGIFGGAALNPGAPDTAWCALARAPALPRGPAQLFRL